MQQIKQEIVIEAIETYIEICNEKDSSEMAAKIVDIVKNKPEISRILVEVTHFVKGINTGKIKRFYYFFNEGHELHGYYQLVFARNVLESRKRMELLYGSNWKTFCDESNIYNNEPSEAIRECKLDPIYVFEGNI